MRSSIVILAVASLLSASVSGQVSITDNHIPEAGDTFRVSLRNTLQFDPAQTGPGFVWDYSTLTPTSQTIDTFFSPLNTNIAYNFAFTNPTDQAHFATVATNNGVPSSVMSFLSITDVYDFYKTNTAKHSHVGFGASFNGIPMPVKNNPVDVVYVLPVNYLSTDTSESAFAVSIPNMGYYGQSKHRENLVDGFGTLKTPFGTFDVVRIKSKLQQTDTIYIDSLGMGFQFDRPDAFEYKWLTDAQSIPILEVRTSVSFGNETVTQVRYRDHITWATGVNEIGEVMALSVWPNPSNGEFNVAYTAEIAEEVLITVTDVSGRIVSKVRHAATQGINQIQMSRELTSGAYFISIETANKIEKERIVIR